MLALRAKYQRRRVPGAPLAAALTRLADSRRRASTQRQYVGLGALAIRTQCNGEHDFSFVCQEFESAIFRALQYRIHFHSASNQLLFHGGMVFFFADKLSLFSA